MQQKENKINGLCNTVTQSSLTNILKERNTRLYQKNCLRCNMIIYGLLGTKYCPNCKKQVVKECKKKCDAAYAKTNIGRLKHSLANKKYRNSDNGRKIQRFLIIKNREKKFGVSSVYTLEQWITKKDSTLGLCPCCSKIVGIKNLTMDHIIPLSKASKGFVYTIDDIQPLCLSCNNKKFTKRIDYYWNGTNPVDALKKYEEYW